MARVYTNNALQQALRAVEAGTSQVEAADVHGIPRQTLQARCKKKNSSTSMAVAKEPSQRLCRDREKKVFEWALDLTRKGNPPTHPIITKEVRDILKETGDRRPLGKNWINSFVRRYPVLRIIRVRRIKRRRRINNWQLGRAASDDRQATESMEGNPANNRDDTAASPRKPKFHGMESSVKSEVEEPSDGRLKTRIELSPYSNRSMGTTTFWEPTTPSPNSLETFKKALKTRVKGLPRQIPGVRLLSRSEQLTRGKSPPLTIVHTDLDSRGVKVPSTHHIDPASWKSTQRGTAVINMMLTEEQGARSRMRNDPGHAKLEWSQYQNMSVNLIEQASDSNGSPQWVFRMSRKIQGQIDFEWKPNSEIEAQQLGHVVGKTWFYCPSVPVLNLTSAFLIYNQIQFRSDIDADQNNDILPIIFVTTFAGRNPEKTWKRYMSSYNGQAHIQFHAGYVTANPPSTITQPVRSEHGEGFGIRRESYILGGVSESSVPLVEGRISIALRTTTDIPQSLYSVVTLAECGAFQDSDPQKVWHDEFRPDYCGQFTGIAVFQSILWRVIQLCKEENTKTIQRIPPRSNWLDEQNQNEAQTLIDAMCVIIDQTTKGIKRLANDCQVTTLGIAELASDRQAKKFNSFIKQRWNYLVATQQTIYEELASMILKVYED